MSDIAFVQHPIRGRHWTITTTLPQPPRRTYTDSVVASRAAVMREARALRALHHNVTIHMSGTAR